MIYTHSSASGRHYLTKTGKNWIAIIFLTCIALAVRLIVFYLSIELPGDGPARALGVFNWANSPDTKLFGVWLPGYYYFSGIFNLLVINDPLISTRLMNVVVGSLTVPVTYHLYKLIFTREVALISALLLALLPIHITLSATSLTETSSLLMLLLTSLFFLRGLDSEKELKRINISLFVIFYWLSAAIRYEAWIFLPVFTMLIFLHFRSFTITAQISLSLSIVPITWMILKALEFGDPFQGHRAAAIDGARAGGVFSLTNPIATADIIITHLFGLVGPIFLIGSLVAILHYLRKPWVLNRGIPKLLILAFLTTFWSVIFVFTIVRGSSLYDRYLSLGVILLLPVATWGVLKIVKQFRQPFLTSCGVLLLSFFMGAYMAPPQWYVVSRSHGSAAQKTAEYVKYNFGHSSVVMTEMEWESSYIPLYYPIIADKYRIVSYFLSDAELEEYISKEQPQLLITKDGDEAQLSRIEAVLGASIADLRPDFSITSSFYYNARSSPEIRVYNIGKYYLKDAHR